MAQDLSIEYPEDVVFITIRTIASRLWFINSKGLQDKICGFLAKYKQEYGFFLYGFIIMGNHYHMLAKFPRGNRSAFLKAFNGVIPRLLTANNPNFIDGSLWARRGKPQTVPNKEDILHQFAYLVLNPIGSGLCRQMSEYTSYNCFFDIVNRISRVFRLVDWTDYSNRKRYNKKLTIEDCTHEYELVYDRLPGYEDLSDEEYFELLRSYVAERREVIIKERVAAGRGFAGSAVLRKMKPGALPRETKKSGRHSKRPLVLTLCAETRRAFYDAYFATLEAYKAASKAYRAGNLSVEFPPWTHRPIIPAAP